MAQRRMFSKTITSSSRFLMMPNSAQNLYFHLGMNADDDGFCEHFMIMRMTESKPDDLRILAAKNFVKVFDDKVLVILDWKENNYLRNDRYKPSKYLEIYKEELALISKESAQLELGIPTGSQMDTQVRLGKDRLGNTSEPVARTGDKNVDNKYPAEWYRKVEDAYQKAKGIVLQSKEFGPIQREAKLIFESGRSVEDVVKTIWVVKSHYDQWTMNTVRMKVPDVVAGALTAKGEIQYRPKEEIDYQQRKAEAIKRCGKCENGYIKVPGVNTVRVCECVRSLAVA